MSKTAISFNVPPKLWESFKQQTDDLFLSRAPFLDYMISRELQHLRSDLKGLKQSLRAKRHVAGAMKRTEPTSVNIEVKPETAEALREATNAHNMVRDAFMSRLIIFLRGTDALLRHLGVPRVASSRVAGEHFEEMPASPLMAMEAVRDDPLFYIRCHLESAGEVGIYRVPLRRSEVWAACYLPDEDIPGTAAYRRQQKQDAAFQAALEDAPVSGTSKTRSAKK